MAAVKLLALVIVAGSLVQPAIASADDVTRWQPFIAEASSGFGIPQVWIDRVIRIESAGQVVWRGRPTTSSAGAMGLMQLMPQTWATMRQRLALGENPHDPRDNILAGSLYLRLMYDRFGYPGLFGAYNARPGRYSSFLTGGHQLPAETRSYLAIAGQDGRRRAPVVKKVAPPADQVGMGAYVQGRAALFFSLTAQAGSSAIFTQVRQETTREAEGG